MHCISLALALRAGSLGMKNRYVPEDEWRSAVKVCGRCAGWEGRAYRISAISGDGTEVSFVWI